MHRFLLPVKAPYKEACALFSFLMQSKSVMHMNRTHFREHRVAQYTPRVAQSFLLISIFLHYVYHHHALTNHKHIQY